MIIYPAIDIKGGRTVQLAQGVMDRATDFGDPCAAARRWQDAGAQYIHVVDLDGAREGVSVNLDTIKQLVRTVNIPVQLGGGIRTLDDIKTCLEDVGVERVILGTVALSNPELVKEACSRWPGRIVVGMDVREGRLALRGWVEDSSITPADIMPRVLEAGVDTVIYTDIRRDGMLAGPNLEATAQLIKSTSMKIIGSGGVSSLEDVRGLKKIGCAGVVIGTALYTGAADIVEVLKV